MKVKKRQQRPRHFEFNMDPVTGFRSNKGTYSGQRGGKRKEMEMPTCAVELDSFDDDQGSHSFQSPSGHNTILGEMKEILVYAKELLVNWQTYVPPKMQKWADRQTTLAESWSESRAIICKAILLSTFAIPEDNMCCKCSQRVAVVRCHQCSSAKHLCSDCDQTVHDCWPFHDRDAVVNDHYVPISATTSKGSDGEWVIVERGLPAADIVCLACNKKCKPLEMSSESDHCTVVTLKGRFDISHRKYQCLGCLKVISTCDPVVLTQSGFWPGSISDTIYVFEQDLLQWDILQKQIPGISEHSFLKSRELYSKQKGRVSVANPGLPFVALMTFDSRCIIGFCFKYKFRFDIFLCF